MTRQLSDYDMGPIVRNKATPLLLASVGAQEAIQYLDRHCHYQPLGLIYSLMLLPHLLPKDL